MRRPGTHRSTQSMADYKVKFEVFEGPLDLLLYLIKKEEVDIYEVNLTKLATQFIEYIELMRELDLDVAGEFLVMAATLMYIKSKELLPVDQQVTPGDQRLDRAANDFGFPAQRALDVVANARRQRRGPVRVELGAGLCRGGFQGRKGVLEVGHESLFGGYQPLPESG